MYPFFPPQGMMDLNLLLSELAQRENLTSLGRELLQDVLRYLHHIGLIIWYEEVKQMESIVFLRPAFLITMFKVSSGDQWDSPPMPGCYSENWPCAWTVAYSKTHKVLME